MQRRKTIYCTLGLLVALLIITSVVIVCSKNDSLKVVFLDVGQGDAILIQQGNTQMLIDGGKDGTRLLEELGKYVPFWDRDIETVVETHPDQDHIGGLAELFRAYNVKAVMKTDLQGTSQTFKHLEDLIAQEQSQVVIAKSGDTISFANGAEAKVLFPFGTVAAADGKDTNAASVAVKLAFGENSFLFTGDLSTRQEEELVGAWADLGSRVLKVGHHGSKYASSDAFLEAVKPRDAVISVGANNAYGHPNQEALDRLRAHHSNIIRTDQSGDIAYDCKNQNSACTVTVQK